MDAQPAEGAPPVVAVLVACDPGPWLEEALAALDNQDYPNLSILVMDASRTEGLAARVGAVVPGAYVRRVAGSRGFGAAANDVLQVVEGASHYLFCHDDVAPDPSAVRVLVEEAFRSNAGVVAPKLVDWDQPERLLAVGMSTDRLANPSPLVERGELDQEQHDAVRDVFVAPAPCCLVRADLFASLSGFDTVLGRWGQDIDLSWRAQVAGARVVVAPAARVRHREAGRRGERRRPAHFGSARRAMLSRNRLRIVLKCYSVLHLVRVLPQQAAITLGEAVWALLNGDTARAGGAVRAWLWNLRQLGELRRARRTVRALRQLPDGEVRRLQAPGHARLSAFLRRQLADEGRGRSVASVSRGLALSLREGSLRLPVMVWGGVVVVLVFGTRHLLGGSVPAAGQLAPLPGGPGPLLRLFLSGWRTVGLGSNAPAPPAFGLLGLAGVVFLTGMGMLRKVLLLGALPLGAAGAYRLAGPLAGRRGRLAAVVLYLAVPLPYDALARGRWSGLLAYAAAPFVLRRLMAASGLAPFAAASQDRKAWAAEVLPLGILLALLGAFVPSALLVVLVAAAGLAAGSLPTAGWRGACRSFTVAAGAIGVAVALLFPWSLHLLGAGWPALTAVAPAAARAPSLGSLLRFHVGPLGGAPAGWAFVVVGVLPLLIGGRWRYAWAVRLWAVALACWAVSWAGGRGWLGFPPPPADVLLAFAAAALALTAALGVVAFERDLPGYVFGWRQGASIAAAIAAVLATIPVLTSAAGGRWNMPSQDDAHLLSWMAAEHRAGDFRVLWVGDPRGLPLEGWQIAPGLAYATSRGGAPDVTSLWPGSSQPATHLLADAIQVARAGRTTRLGHLLAPMAVRYLILPRRLSPGPSPGASLPLPADLTAALQDQLDLKQVEGDPSLLLYENVAWAPEGAVLPDEAVAPSRARQPTAASAVELAGAAPVLRPSAVPTSFTGRVPPVAQVLFAEAYSGRWKLDVAGRSTGHRRAFGWANAYSVAGGGKATLRYRTPVTRYLAVVVELALWALAVRAVVRLRRGDEAEEGTAAAPPEEDSVRGPGPHGPVRDMPALSGGAR